MCILPHSRDVFRGLHSVFFLTFAVSSCVKPAGIIVQIQEICWTVTKRIDSSCSVRCHALHDCHQTWSFQQAPSSNLINMRCGWALPSQCVGSTQLGFRSGHLWLSCVIAADNSKTFNDVITPHPTHPPTHPNPTCYVASSMCATSTMSLHPTPPTHPNPTCYVASNMCATSTMSLHPTPPTHPNPTCYVASNMCATSTMSLHPTPPTHPTQPTWQAWRKMHWSHRLQWAKHVPKRVVTSDWSQKQTIIFSWDLFHANIFGKTDFSVTNQPVPSGKLTWLAGKWTCWRCIPYLNMGIFRCEILAYRSVTSKSHRQPRSLHQQVPFEHIWYLIKHSPYQTLNASYLVGPNHLIILVGKLVI